MLDIGETLREARRQRGLQLEDAAAATLIRLRYLEALEEERFELLPAGSYRRTFLREYADYLGVGGETLAAEYDLRFPSPEPEPPPPGYRQALLELRGIPLAPTIAIVGALALVAAAIWELGGTPGVKAPANPPVAVRQAAAPQRAHSRTSPPLVQKSAQAKPSAGPPAVLVLTAATGRCWLLVRVGSASGRTVYERTLEQGQTVRLGLRKPLWIEIGAPWALRAMIGRRLVSRSLPTKTGSVLASVSGLRSIS